ncbi:MAG: hypothetical protein ABIG84_04630 [archaeon]
MDDEITFGNEDVDEEIKKKMKLIEGKMKEIRELRVDIRELNKRKAKKRAIRINVPADKKEEIQKRIKEMMEEYAE